MKTSCTSCGKTFKISDKHIGKKLKCPCGNILQAAASKLNTLGGEPPENGNENLISCPDCTQKISKKAVACPACGCPTGQSEAGFFTQNEQESNDFFTNLEVQPQLERPSNFHQQVSLHSQSKNDSPLGTGPTKDKPRSNKILLFSLLGVVSLAGIVIAILPNLLGGIGGMAGDVRPQSVTDTTEQESTAELSRDATEAVESEPSEPEPSEPEPVSQEVLDSRTTPEEAREYMQEQIDRYIGGDVTFEQLKKISPLFNINHPELATSITAIKILSAVPAYVEGEKIPGWTAISLEFQCTGYEPIVYKSAVEKENGIFQTAAWDSRPQKARRIQRD